MLRLAEEGLLRSGVYGWNAVAVAARTADRTRFLMIMMIVVVAISIIIHSPVIISTAVSICNQGTFSSDLDGAVSLPSLIFVFHIAASCFGFVRVALVEVKSLYSPPIIPLLCP